MANKEKAEPKGKGKVGRPKNIQSPEHFLQLFMEYKAWAKANPRVENLFSAKECISVPVDRERPLTWEDFDTWLYDNDIIHDTERYRGNENGAYEEFRGVVTRVRKAMYADKFTGAAVGIFNPSLIARDLGIADSQKHDHTTKGKEIKSFDLTNLTTEQIDALIALHGEDKQ